MIVYCRPSTPVTISPFLQSPGSGVGVVSPVSVVLETEDVDVVDTAEELCTDPGLAAH